MRTLLSRRLPLARLVGALVAGGSILLSGGCASSNATRNAKDSGDYVKAFESGRYALAYDQASKASQEGSGFKRDQAALTAGLAAHALNRNADAERFLTPLTKNSDAKIAAEASATMGLICAETNRHEQATDLLTTAGRSLEGDQAARAFMYAGDSFRSLGKTTEARGMWSLAQTKVTNDASLRVMIGDRLSNSNKPSSQPKPATASGQFTVQVGAFSNFTNAQKQVSRFKAYGNPRVVETTRAGKKLFVVRVGTYPTRQAAERVAKNIGPEAKVMAATGE
jgi:predicted negative regulator of RcsB-dependent stress response